MKRSVSFFVKKIVIKLLYKQRPKGTDPELSCEGEDRSLNC